MLSITSKSFNSIDVWCMTNNCFQKETATSRMLHKSAMKSIALEKKSSSTCRNTW